MLERVVIVGASPAGLSTAETLRREGFTGRLVLIDKESRLPPMVGAGVGDLATTSDERLG
ncbi:NAD(P)-binding protein [Kribbella sp. NPDC050820]|uniref:NAD(P)-binding protein n=1 Tax=Kribbella sp. NPDC050820 TaxID=3155408 RepID=UPI0033F9BAE7